MRRKQVITLRHINKRMPISQVNPASPISESYRALRTQLDYSESGRRAQVLTASSAMPREGKTTTLMNMAIVYAQENKRVVFIDADMRRSNAEPAFQVPGKHGLSTYLEGHCELPELVRGSMIPNLDVIPSGPSVPNPTDVLGSSRMDTLIEALRGSYDVVLIDSPPVLPVADGRLIAAKCDGVVLVVHSVKSKRGQVKKAKAHLERVNARILGVVLNGSKDTDHESLYRSYMGRL